MAAISSPAAANNAARATARPRLQKVDILRGLALLGMGIYHFSWDLAYFGYIPPERPESGGFVILARIVAAAFLALAGFSLVLAQGAGFRARVFFRRLGLIIAAAALVSAASYVFMPQDFIYFGILHQIAFASCFGLLFLYAPLWFNAACVLLFAAMPWAAAAARVDIAAPAWWWLGLSANAAPSFDYVPLFPWFACFLAGQSAAQLLARRGRLSCLRAGIKPQFLSRLLQFIGRHSLALYLLHQPVLLALLWALAQLAPPSYNFAAPKLTADCAQTCAAESELAPCRRFCACVVDGLAKQRQLGRYLNGALKLTDAPMAGLRQSCAQTYLAPPPAAGGPGQNAAPRQMQRRGQRQE